MSHNVWISDPPVPPRPGWQAFRTITEFAAGSCRADRIVVDDPAAALRQIDWLTLYSAAPMARIVRRVGPWRAGVERTDPQWPASSTVVTESTEELLYHLDLGPVPFTAAYDERAVVQPVSDLRGLSVQTEIRDADLRETWDATLCELGAILDEEGPTELLISDGDAAGDTRWTIRLAADPWNVLPQEHQLIASVLDPPAMVLGRWIVLRNTR